MSNYINETYQSNFNGWLNDLRIEEAKQKIISSPEINLSDLAEMVGFADQAHFSKQFKQKEGIPPSVWKKEHRAKSEKINILHFCRKIHNYIQIDKQERSIYA